MHLQIEFTIINYPHLNAYHFIMLLLAISGAFLLFKEKLIGLRLLFFSTLMYVFYKILDHAWALEYLSGSLDDPTGNPLLDYLQMEYLKLKVLPRTEIPLQNKIFYYYQWGLMPFIQIILFFVLPFMIFKTKTMPYNRAPQPTPKSGAAGL